jgi:pimeloyl-ACP methyl ester carboxylesterase
VKQQTLPEALEWLWRGYPTTVHEGYVDAGGGLRLFYRIVGTRGDTVVVLHGGPGFSMGYLAADLEPLAARHVLLFYDQRGTGRSTLVTDSASLDGQRFAEDLEAVRSQFKLRRLTLLAHSWGAGVAALYATQHPQRVGRLLIVDPISVRRTYHARGLQSLDARRDSATQRRLRELAAARLANPGDVAACRAYFGLWSLATFADSAAARRSRGDFCADTRDPRDNRSRSTGERPRVGGSGAKRAAALTRGKRTLPLPRCARKVFRCCCDLPRWPLTQPQQAIDDQSILNRVVERV